jgi:hypothetical protein
MYSPNIIIDIAGTIFEQEKVYLICRMFEVIDMESINHIDSAIDEVSIDKVLEELYEVK